MKFLAQSSIGSCTRVFLSLDASRREMGIAMTVVAHGHTELQTGFFATRGGHREVLLLYFGATEFYED